MRNSLSGVKARVERLTVQRQAEAVAVDWDALVAVLASARTDRRPCKEMTPEEFASWSERLRASVRGTSEAKRAEQLIAGGQRAMEYATKMARGEAAR